MQLLEVSMRSDVIKSVSKPYPGKPPEMPQAHQGMQYLNNNVAK
jgi:hypothetical protein